MSIVSISATVKYQDLDKFDWRMFKGPRRINLEVRNQKRPLQKGDVYGIRQVKGDKYYVIFPDAYHVVFIVSKKRGESIIEKSSRRRKMPKIEDVRAGVGRQRAQRIDAGRKFDPQAARFKPPSKVPNEKKAGVDFDNYQWRKFTDTKFKYSKSATKGFELKKGDKFGLRFFRPARGGFIVLEDGQYWPIPTKYYDELVESSAVLPLTRWPKGKLSAEEIKSFQERKIENQKKRDKEEREAEQERVRALKAEHRRKKRLEAAKKREEKRIAAKRAIKSEPKIFDEVKKVGNEDYLAENLRRIEEEDDDDLIKSIDDLGADDEIELDIDSVIDDEDDVDVDEDDNETIEDDEIDLVEADQKGVEEAFDAELEKTKEMTRANMIMEEDEEDNIDLDDVDEEYDIEEDDEIPEEDDEDEDSLDAQNARAEQDEALDSAEYEDEYDLEEDEEDSESEETEDDEQESSDEEDSDDEEPEEEQTFEEGDVITFEKDETEQREFLILDIYPLKNNDAITVYKVYDIEADDGEYRTFRVNTKTKARIEKVAKFVRKLNPKEFSKYYSAMDGYEKNPEPITS